MCFVLEWEEKVDLGSSQTVQCQKCYGYGSHLFLHVIFQIGGATVLTFQTMAKVTTGQLAKYTSIQI